MVYIPTHRIVRVRDGWGPRAIVAGCNGTGKARAKAKAGLFRVSRHDGVGQVLKGCFAVDVVDSPDSVVLGVRPRSIWRGCAEGGSQLGNLSMVPDYQHDLAGVFAAEESGG